MGFPISSISNDNILVMKKLLLVLVSVFGFSVFTHAQTVYSCQYSSDANVKVFVADYKSDADLVVYKCDYKSDATGNQGLWYFVNYKSDADKRIFFTKYKSDAQLIIYFSKYKSDAGWRNKSKQHLMY